MFLGALLRALVFTFLLANVACANPVITEVMADNVSFLPDEDGANSVMPDGPGTFTSLSLKVRYKDGYVACLNGVFVSATANPDGTETLLYRAPNPQTTNGPRFFLRLKSTIMP